MNDTNIGCHTDNSILLSDQTHLPFKTVKCKTNQKSYENANIFAKWVIRKHFELPMAGNTLILLSLNKQETIE